MVHYTDPKKKQHLSTFLRAKDEGCDKLSGHTPHATTKNAKNLGLHAEFINHDT